MTTKYKGALSFARADHVAPAATNRRSRPVVAAWCIASTLLGSSPAALAAPTDGQITGGTGAISQPDATTTRIDQASGRLAIDWQSFDVAPNETVQFVQPSADAVALNRIFDQKASQILGAIDANGRVFLVNPNGVIFGRDARINVAGLVASSLDMQSNEFMNGRYTLEAQEGTEGGPITNQGVIQTTPGGFVVLTGGAVLNEGVILADLGTIELAAGHKATLDFQGDGMLLFEVDQALAQNVTGADAAVANTGTLRADGGRILLTAKAASDVFSQVVNNSGVVRANRIDNTGGEIRLVADGGDTINTGSVDASAGDSVSTGGSVQILGDRVGLFGNATVDASGATDGGTVLIGGDYQGTNAAVKNSRQTIVGAGASISADAGASGDGGRVIVWSDGTTSFRGDITARGGAVAGDGGFVETSGKGSLSSSGSVDASATNGAGGQWLLDPADVTITTAEDNGGFDDGDPNTFTPDDNEDTATVDVDDIVDSLEGGTSVTILTTNVGGNGAGDITVATTIAPVMDGGAATLTLNAENNIVVNEPITATGDDGMGLTLQAAGIVDINDPITTNGGAFTSTGTDFDNTGGAIDTGAGDIAITHTGTVTVGADLTGNNIVVTAGTASTAAVAANVAIVALGNLTVTAQTINLGADTTLEVDDGNAVAATLQLLASGTLTLGANAALVGNGTDDTLAGPNVDQVWTINGANTGSLGGTSTFAGFANLSGGTGSDRFTFDDDGAVTSIDGNGGNDYLDYTLLDATEQAPVAVALSALAADGSGAGTATRVTATFADINSLDARSAAVVGATDSLTGPNAVTTWTVTGIDSGTLDTDTGTAGAFAFTNVENLSGGTLADTFNVNANVTGTVNGGAGDDTFNLTEGFTAGTLDGGAGGETNGDTLVAVDDTPGAESANTWTVTTLDQDGTVQTFQGIENLQGDASADAFTIGAALTGSVSGNAGIDTIDVNATVGGQVSGGTQNDTITIAANVAGGVAGGAGNDTITVDGIATANIDGGDDADAITVAQALTGNVLGSAGVDNITVNNLVDGTVSGGTEGDTITLNANVTGGVNGDAGADAIDVNVAQTGAVSGGTEGDTITVGASVAGGVAGNAGNDTITVDGIATANIDGGDDADAITIAQALTGNVLGSAGVDNITVNNVVDGTVSGGTEGDTITLNANVTGGVNGDAGADAIDVNVAQTGAVSGGTEGDTITVGASVVGGVAGNAGNDTITVDGVATAGIDGGDGDDAITVNQTLTGSVLGNAGADTIDINNVVNGAVLGGTEGDTITLDANVTGGVNGDAGVDTIDINVAQTAAVSGGTDADTITVGASVAGGVAGNAGNDTITVDGVATANIDGGDDADAITVNQALTGSVLGSAGADTIDINNVVNGAVLGGTEGDTITLDANVTGGVNGDAGVDSIDVNVAQTGAVTGGTEADTITVGATVAGGVAGNAGNDTITVDGVATANIDAGDGDDLITVAQALTGNVSGGAGIDNIDINASVTGAVAGGTEGDLMTIGASVSGGVAGDAGGDSITVDGASTANIDAGDGDDAITVNQTLTGTVAAGAGADTIGINAATTGVISGDDGDDTFNLNGDGEARGGAGNDAFNLTSGTGNLAGEDGSDTVAAGGDFTVDGVGSGTASGRTFATMETLSGTGANTLSGPATATTWNVTAANAGNLTGGAEIAFNGMETLQGGGATDTFNLAADVVANGGAGSDQFNLTGGTGAIAGEDGEDTVAGPNAATTWAVTANNTGTVVSRAFTGIEMLQGGTAVDTFNLDGNVAANGGGGDDQFNLTSGAGDVAGGDGSDTITAGGNFTAVGLGGGTAAGRTFATMESLSGTGTNTLTGPGADTTWNVTAASGGNLAGGATIAFSGMETLQGGAAVDTFNLNGNVVANGGAGNDLFVLTGGTGAIAGEGDTDTVAGPNVATTWDVTAANTGTATSSTTQRAFTTMENVSGGNAVDTFNLNGNIAANGGAGDDAFNLTSGTGDLAGGDGSDTVTASGAFTAVGAGGGSAAGRNIATMERLSGNSNADTLTGTAAAGTTTSWNVTGTNDGNATGGAAIAFDGMETLRNGVGNDSYLVQFGSVGVLATPALSSGSLRIETELANRSGTDTVAIGAGGADFGTGTLTVIGVDAIEFASNTTLIEASAITFTDVSRIGSNSGRFLWNEDTRVELGGVTDGDLFFTDSGFLTFFLRNRDTGALTAFSPDLDVTYAGCCTLSDLPTVRQRGVEGFTIAQTAGDDEIEVIYWSEFDADLRLFDVNNPGVLLPPDQRVDELTMLFQQRLIPVDWSDSRTLVGLRSLRN